MNRRKLIGLVGALVAAALGTFAMLSYSKGGTTVAAPAPAAAEATVPVLSVTKVVPKNTPASQLEQYVTVVQVPAGMKQQETVAAFTDIKDTGMVTNADLLVGDQVSMLRLAAPGASGGSVVEGEAGEFDDLVGVWVNVPTLYALNGNLKPGVTRVAVFAAFEPMTAVGADPTKDVSSNHLIAHKVPVLDVYPPVGAAAAAQANGQPPVIPPAIQVKLGLDAATAERVVFAQLKGTIYLGEESLSVPEDGTKVVERGNVMDATQRGARVAAKPATKPGAPTVVGAAKVVDPKTAPTPVATVVPAGATPATVAPAIGAPLPAASAPVVQPVSATPSTIAP